jgi:hypothetical protein
MLSILVCTSLSASIHTFWNNACHLVAFKSNLFIFKVAIASLCDPPHPPLSIEVALLQTIAFNNDDSPPKHLIKRKHLNTLIMLVYWLHVLSWSNYCISIHLILLTIAKYFID